MNYLHRRLLVFCLCIALFFTSCGTSAAESARQEGVLSGQNAEETPLSAGDAAALPQMQIISSHSGIIASGMVGNQNGCYEVLDRPVGDGNILYTDYATKSRIYLSSRITGDHTDESDPSWLKSTVGGCFFRLHPNI